MLPAFAIYLILHFGLYVALLRNCRVFQLERVIFLYHFVPALTLATICLADLSYARTLTSLTYAVLLIGLQGIYSVTFLEFWSLAQLGYSVDILVRCQRAQDQGALIEPTVFSEIGASKKSERLAGLMRLDLVAVCEQGYSLTQRGRLVAWALALLQRLTSCKGMD